MKATLEKIQKEISPFLTIVGQALESRKNESDTVDIVRDMIVSVLGFDRYNEVTSEQRLEGKFCDLLVMQKSSTGKIRNSYIVEVKAVKEKLKDNHVEQAENYAAKKNLEFVILTNAVEWRLYRVSMKGGLKRSLVAKINLFDEPIEKDILPFFYAISRDGLANSALKAYGNKSKFLTPFVVGQLLVLEPVIEKVCSLLREMSGEDISPSETRSVIERAIRENILGKDAKEATAASRLIHKHFNSQPKPVKDAKTAQPPLPTSQSGIPVVISGRGASASGILRSDGGVTVLAGSSIAANLVPSAVGKSMDTLRRQLVSDGAISGGAFTRDHAFPTSSAAASVILGRSANGNDAWHIASTGAPIGTIRKS